ncbi:Ig-like domain-containing protein [Spirochaeta isovalerica]|uniref:SbsA Ig-like domain-containing protein n=1 Tax=Spirochaeta isovalerica TaxID=150 RepID=A0A841R910_9SPIO|nr:Ig-like domain-containing protein [Spirochaeta isovalerica]MBB6480395.1 hypothetical protein [Spirochaeta isovalerica]
MISKRIIVASIVFVLFHFALVAGNKPLSLSSSSPENGASGISVDAVLELEFSNNVVNLSVQENNKASIVLRDGDGKVLEIEVIFPDDQLEPEKKRMIAVRPVSPLEKGTLYTLEIAPTFQAKNGSSLAEPVELTFTTVK